MPDRPLLSAHCEGEHMALPEAIRTHGPRYTHTLVLLCCLEGGQAPYLDGLCVKLEPFLLVDQELFDILALVTLKLNHLAHLSVVDDGSIASCRIHSSALSPTNCI